MSANVGQEALSLGRDLVRRGLTPLALRAYRTSQNVTWQRWMSIVFQLTSDIEEMHELLDVSASSIFSFIDATNAAVTTEMQGVRDELTETVELVSLVTEDANRADQFIRRRLGGFESASPELRTAVRVFVDEQCNASRAATRLYTHRNTLLRQLSRADQLLPRPLADNSVNVAVALEVLHWRGGEV